VQKRSLQRLFFRLSPLQQGDVLADFAFDICLCATFRFDKKAQGRSGRYVGGDVRCCY